LSESEFAEFKNFQNLRIFRIKEFLELKIFYPD